MPGVESQLGSHVRISLNVGITRAQLGQVAGVLADAGFPDAAERMTAALAS
jgi:alkylhydroperoxidase/carboxymuconolactone decarboxylase family protein YurZ